MIHANAVDQMQERRKAFLVNSGSNIAPLLTAWKKLVIHCFSAASAALSLWKSVRTANVIERLNGVFRRRVQNPSHPPLCRDRIQCYSG